MFYQVTIEKNLLCHKPSKTTDTIYWANSDSKNKCETWRTKKQFVVLPNQLTTLALNTNMTGIIIVVIFMILDTLIVFTYLLTYPYAYLMTQDQTNLQSVNSQTGQLVDRIFRKQ